MKKSFSTFRRTSKPIYKPPTFAAALLLHGQRLRANESATPTTFALPYAAKWAQARGGR